MSPTQSISLDARVDRKVRLRRRISLLVLAIIGVVAVSGCLPGVPLSQWVPDANNDGGIDATEIAAAQQSISSQVAAATDAQRHQVQLHSFLVCVRHRESDRSVYPFTKGYAAQNPRSTASGAYQFLDGTWHTWSARAGFGGYARAMNAPWYVQDAVALFVFNSGGRSNWNGDGC